MKKYFVVSVFVLGVLGTLSAHALSEVETPKAKMHRLSQESQKQGTKCDAFGRDAKALLGKEDADAPWKWDDRDTHVAKLVRLLGSYPGESSAAKEARALLAGTHDPDANFDLEDLTHLRNCEILSYYDLFKKWNASVATAPEKSRQSSLNALIGIVTRELRSTGTLFHVLVVGAMIETLSEWKSLPGLASQKDRIAQVQLKAQAMKGKMRATFKESGDKSYPRIWAQETSIAKELSADWLDVLKKANLATAR